MRVRKAVRPKSKRVAAATVTTAEAHLNYSIRFTLSDASVLEASLKSPDDRDRLVSALARTLASA